MPDSRDLGTREREKKSQEGKKRNGGNKQRTSI